MYIPVRSAGGWLAYKMPFIPMNVPAYGAVGPLCVKYSVHSRRGGDVTLPTTGPFRFCGVSRPA